MAAPSITITNPENGKAYTKGTLVAIAYTCLDAVDCVGTLPDGSPAPNGSMLQTTVIGPSYITVTAHDAAGASSVAQSAYNVVESGTTDPGGGTPATLNLTLGTPTAFAPFIPGLDRSYTATLTAQILSTAGDATLSVADPSAVQTGHLVNGTYFLPAGLQVGGTKPPPAGQQPVPPTFAPLGGSASPTTVLTYNGPVNETDTLTFSQAIGAGDSLRTGAYSKTLTFTLSTTNP